MKMTSQQQNKEWCKRIVARRVLRFARFEEQQFIDDWLRTDRI